MSSPVFISYRRSESQYATGRLFDRLAPRFLAPAEVFMDLEAIAPGADFVAALQQQLRDCRVCLVMIGPRWLDERDAGGQRRLDNPADFVRLEVAAALANPRIVVIPVLLDDARMPAEVDLPEPLKPLATRNAEHIVSNRFLQDSDALAAKVLHALGRSPDPELDLIKLFFSFKGTIARKRFWFGFLAISLIYYGVLWGVLWSIGKFKPHNPFATAGLTLREHVMVELATVWVWWPMLALAWKRIRDLGQGWGLFAPLFGLAVIHLGFVFLGMRTESLATTLIYETLLVVIGGLRGTRFVAHDI